LDQLEGWVRDKQILALYQLHRNRALLDPVARYTAPIPPSPSLMLIL
jgi:hypothetical protein